MIKSIKSNIKPNIMYLFAFFVYFVMQCKFLHYSWFETDELDIMTGGKAIANGYTLYDEFLSQHMPFSYYISAVFDFFGASSVSLQRLCFYGLFALLWTIILYRYRNIVTQKALFLFPIIHMSLITVYDMGTVILSEHLAGIGSVIMILEFLSFYQKKELKWHSCVFLSISVVLTFGTIFIGIFSVFIVGVAVVCTEISWWIEDKKKIAEKCKEWLSRYIPLICWCALPWSVLCIVYAIKGNLLNFIHEAYGINRGIYPKYIGGYGSSIAATFIDIPSALFAWAKKTINTEHFGLNIVIYAIVLIMVILYIVKQYKEGKKIYAVFVGLYLSSMATRGIFDFHSTHMVETAALICAIYLVDWIQNEKEIKAAVICGFLLLVPYWSDLSGFTKDAVNMDKTIPKIIDATVEPGEAIWQLSFSNAAVMIADRPSICNVAAVPWMWQGQGTRVLEKIQDDMPKVALYDEEHEVWGYKLTDYAPELAGFMAQNYTQYEDTEVYIRNDVYDSYSEKIKEKMYGTKSRNVEIIGSTCNDDVYEQSIDISNEAVTGVLLYCATYARTNDCNIHLELLQDDVTVTEKVISASELNDCSYNEIQFDDKVTISDSSNYKIRICFDSIAQDMSNAITLAYASKLYDENNHLYINGKDTGENLAFFVVGE